MGFRTGDAPIVSCTSVCQAAQTGSQRLVRTKKADEAEWNSERAMKVSEEG